MSKIRVIFNKPFVHVLAILFVSSVIYSGTFNAPLQFDDRIAITENPGIGDPYNYLPPRASRDVGFLTFSLNYRLDGLDVFGYHVVNLLIHMLNALLVYALVSLTFRTPFFRPWLDLNNAINHRAHREPPEIKSLDKAKNPSVNSVVLFSSISKRSVSFAAFFACGLFAVHPLQTEAVTYIVQRFTSLATFFYLLSLVMYIKWREDKEQQVKRYAPRALFYAISLLSAVLAMKTKEIAFTLPVCIAVYEFMFFRGKPVKRLLYLIPLLLTMLIIPLTLLNLSAPLGDIIGDVSEVTRDHRGISRWSYLFTQFRVIVTYLRLLVLPINQNLDYDFPLYHSLFDPAVFLSFMFVLLVFGLGVYLHRISGRAETNKKYWLRLTSFGIFWFFLALSVESSVIPLRDMIFEHRLYLPSVGFFMAVTTAIGAGMERWGDRAAYLKKAVLYAMLAVMLALSGAAYARNTVWQDRIRLWGNAIEGSPNKARPHYNLGNAYKAHDRTYEAINEYQTAIKLKPDYADPHNNLGVAYFDQGRIYEAMNEYQTALRLKPDYADAHNNMGNAYLKQGRIQEAINEYQTAIKLKPDYVKAHYNLGVAYEAQKRTDEAMRAYQTAIRLKPDYANAHNNLGNIYAEQGRFAEAINEYRTALRFNPEDFVARKNLEILQSKTPAALN